MNENRLLAEPLATLRSTQRRECWQLPASSAGGRAYSVRQRVLTARVRAGNGWRKHLLRAYTGAGSTCSLSWPRSAGRRPGPAS